jgi:RNA polymerase sigma-70 factor (ECF subfamily)
MSTAPPDETELVLRAQARDAGAFEDLVSRHAPRVWRLAHRMVGGTDAADVVQQTFIAAWQALDRFRAGESFAPWLMTIATHRCLNCLRSRKRSRAEALDLVHYRVADPGADPGDRVERQEQAAMLAQAVDALPATAAAIVTLHYMEAMSCAQIGEVLGMQESAVKVALFRARGKLRDILNKTRGG